MRQIELQVRELEVKREMLLESARQDLRMEILPVEQTPALAESLSRVFQGAHLTVYGGDNLGLAPVLPMLEILAKAVREALSGNGSPSGNQGRKP
jgi:hypothetical protein